jgi:cytochrome c553
MDNNPPPLALRFSFLTLLALTGCSWGFGPGEAEPPEMHRQFSRTVDIQTGVVVGDLARAQEAGAWIATHQDQEALGPDLDAYRAEIRGYAALISQAGDLDTVSRHTGHMAAACGRCHEASSGGPHFVVAGGPPQGSPTAQQMILHLWATDRMWEGLIGPSEESWKAGAEALLDSWDTAQVLRPASSTVNGFARPTARMHRLAQEAAAATTTGARASAYGKVLATCNDCHATEGLMAER